MTNILEEASELINGERAQTYGPVTDNFDRIAALWNSYVDQPDEEFYRFDAYDVANMMILVKLARIKNAGYHRDSYADIAGYAALAEKVNDESACSPCAPVAQSFWDAIDQDILEAQEKRERETTSKPPRVWESLCEVPHSVVVKDQIGDHWDFYIKNWGYGTPGEIRRYPVDLEAWGAQAYDYRGPFTEVLS